MRFRALTIGSLVLVGATAAARPHAPSHRAPPTLLLIYDVTNDADTLHQAWFVDGEGRAFTFARNGARDPLNDAQRAGGLTSRDVAALISASRPLPTSIATSEVDRARALLPGAQHSRVWTHRRRDACPAGVTIAVRGYLWPPGKPAEVVPLRETTCHWLVDENLAPEAQELIDWVYRQSGMPRPRLRR